MILAPTLLLNAGSGAAIARPTFSRDFAGEKTLNNGTGPAITFTRGTNATYFDASGTLRFAPNNHIRNSEATGATVGVIGSGGVMPTNWAAGTGASSNGISSEIIGTGVENGLAYIDIKVSGTPTATSTANFFTDATNQIAASSGQTWSGSAYVKRQSGSLTSATVVVILETRNSSNVFVADGTSQTITPTNAALNTQRVTMSDALSDASVAFVNLFIRVNYTNGNPIDLTLRIAAPQLEIGSTATDYNPTTGTAYFGPRFDHSGGSSLGLLIEEARTNLLTRSAEFDNAAWTAFNMTVSANAATSPAGGTVADLVYPTASSATGAVVRQDATVSASTAYTFSCFIKPSGKNFTYLQINSIPLNPSKAYLVTINASNGSVGTLQNLIGTTTGVTTTATSVGNGWYRCATTFTTDADVTSIRCFVGVADQANDRNVTTVGTDGLLIWGAQLEQGAFPTSYIPTTTAAATRSADSAVVTPISSFYNQAEGTLFAEVREGGSDLQYGAVSLDTDTSDNRIDLRRNNDAGVLAMLVTTAGALQMLQSPVLAVAAQTYKLSGAYKVNDCAVCVNGGAVATDASVTLPTLTHFRIGALTAVSPATGPSFFLNGHIRKIAYWPRRLSNTLLQQLTT
jgi:hypothetical protein